MSTVMKKRKGGDLGLPQAIAILKEEILEEVRRTATGKQSTIYPIMERGRELVELEEELARATPAKSATAPARKSPPPGADDIAGPITPIKADDF
jgi:hypothetical protein